MMKRWLFSIFLLFIAVPVSAMTPNDPLFERQWYLNKIGASNAWDQTTGSSDIIVAVLDTGFDMDHPDLINNVWTNAGEVLGDGIDNDNNGYVDDVHGYDFVGDDGDPIPDRDLPIDREAAAHGTMIAGIIGASGNNGVGIAGLNWHVRLMNVRILNNEGSGDSIAAKEAIEYAVHNGARVINLSFTGFAVDPSFKDALRKAYEAGVVIVAAVGNTKNGGINVDDKPIYPACHGDRPDEDWVIGVGASNSDDVKSDFSNYGSTCTDLSAPGEQITSTTYQDDTWSPFVKSYYETGWSGTSMAVPMVSGALALLLSVYPLLTPADLETILRLSVDPISSSGDALGKVGAGRLNVAHALALVPTFAKTLTPAAAHPAIPETAPGALIKLACQGQSAMDDPCRAVYYYATDGKRHAFSNERVFFSWYTDFSSVMEVSKSSLSALPLGKNVTYHPGTRLVKFQSVPTVYAVSKGGVLRPIPHESIAQAWYGMEWNKQVDDIADVFFGNYKQGTAIASSIDYDPATARASVSSISDNFTP
ncbi:S8 family serine peptidase [Candidatus Uhrbacteria bacterium]|nr:S8 family serine peptidase [Candidatus Uhrbacteria bacterium]